MPTERNDLLGNCPSQNIILACQLPEELFNGTPENTIDEQVRLTRSTRAETTFRQWIRADGSTPFLPEANRYVLYVSYVCPWASRCLAYRTLKGLEDCIGVAVVQPQMADLEAAEAGQPIPKERTPESVANSILLSEKNSRGWIFASTEEGADEESTLDPWNHVTSIRQLYWKAQPDYRGKYSVPALWDLKTQTLVNNESADITQMLNSEFNAFAKNPALNLRPDDLLDSINQTNDWMYNSINNGVYRCGFAQSQNAYEEAFDELFAALEQAEKKLEQHRFLNGNRLTDSDIRLFVTIVRFDVAYHGYFKCNLKRIEDYPNLRNWVRDLYQVPGISSTVSLRQIKMGYGQLPQVNPFGIIPKGPTVDFTTPHNRKELFAGNIFTGQE